MVHSSNPLIRTRFPVPPGPVLVPTSVLVLHALVSNNEVVHENLHVGERGHERLRRVRDGRSPDRRCAAVDRERALGRVVLGDTRRILAAPGLGVAPSELE